METVHWNGEGWGLVIFKSVCLMAFLQEFKKTKENESKPSKCGLWFKYDQIQIKTSLSFASAVQAITMALSLSNKMINVCKGHSRSDRP